MTTSSPAFSLSMEENVMTIHCHPLSPQKNSQIVQDLTLQLDALTQAGLLKGGPLLKITGKQSLPMAYVISHVVSHRYGAIAVYDPNQDDYLVSLSHDPDFPVGHYLNELHSI